MNSLRSDSEQGAIFGLTQKFLVAIHISLRTVHEPYSCISLNKYIDSILFDFFLFQTNLKTAELWWPDILVQNPDTEKFHK